MAWEAFRLLEKRDCFFFLILHPLCTEVGSVIIIDKNKFTRPLQLALFFFFFNTSYAVFTVAGEDPGSRLSPEPKTKQKQLFFKHKSNNISLHFRNTRARAPKTAAERLRTLLFLFQTRYTARPRKQ